LFFFRHGRLWSNLILAFFLFFKNLASIRNPAAYQAAIYARLQREYLEWRKDEDLREKARKEREERKEAKAAWLAKPPPPGFTKDSKGYLRRIRPEEMATRSLKKITKAEQDVKRAGWLLRNSTNRAAAFAAARSVGMSIPPTMSGTTMQAIRTGGWANPVRGGELKFVDVNSAIAVGGAGVTTFGTGILLNGLANGSDASTRIGRKVNLKSIYVRWSALFVAGAGGGGAIRILVVYDKQANATAPVITDILLANDFNSPNNLSNRDRFVTLCDYVTEQLSTASNLSDTGVIRKGLNLETMFNAGSAGTIGDITSGSVYMFIAQSGGITTTAPTMSYRSRIRYTDV